MLVASVSLSMEGYERDKAHGAWRVVLGNVLGAVLLLTTDYLLHGYDAVLAIGELRGADARKALLVVGIMTVHSFAEGVGIGVSFGGRESDRADLGVLITSTIAAHNAPEVRAIDGFLCFFGFVDGSSLKCRHPHSLFLLQGLAIAMVMVPRGTSVFAAALWAVFSSMPQPLSAVPAFLFVQAFQDLLPIGLGFASGAMVWMVLSELLPDARKAQSDTELITLMLGAAIFPALYLFSSSSAA